MTQEKRGVVSNVKAYWESHPLGTQFVRDRSVVAGTQEFFSHIRPWMTPYRFPEIMLRIEREARHLPGKHLLEIGCGMGFDSAEFLKRGVQVTATDLTQSAVELARKHFDLEHLTPVDVRQENVLSLSFADHTFDAVWACGVVHHTGDPRQAMAEVYRVLKPGGRAVISHFYRRFSWMYFLSRYSQENIEFKEEDPPVSDFMTDQQILSLFDRFAVEEVEHDHYRALPISRRGWKAALYTWGFRPAYNLLPRVVAKRLAYKLSVTAVKPALVP